jgi:site-specific recombinase XerD/ribosomal protein L40E
LAEKNKSPQKRKRGPAEENKDRFHEKIWRILDSVKDRDSRQAIIEYLDFMQANGRTSFYTIKNTSNVLRNLANAINKPLILKKEEDGEEVAYSDVSDKDINRYYSDNKDIMAKTSLAVSKSIVRPFFKYHLSKNGEGYPENVANLKVKRVEVSRNPMDMLNESDVLKMIKASPNIRNKAILSLLWETGMRKGELLSLRVKDIYFEDGSADIYIEKSKTGPRTITVVSSLPFLREWIENSPNKNNKDGSLWTNIYGKADSPLSTTGLENLIKKATESAEIDKPTNAHAWRHSRATERSLHWPNSRMTAFFGWERNSKMPQYYSHLSGADHKKEYRREHGLDEPEKEEYALTPKVCFECEQENRPDARFCVKCYRPLDADVFRDHERREKIVNQEVGEWIEKMPEDAFELLAKKIEKRIRASLREDRTP